MILDTSAIIGLFELAEDRTRIRAAILRHGGEERPAVHHISLGELWAGVFKAEREFGPTSIEAVARRRTVHLLANPVDGGRGGFLLLPRVHAEEFGRVTAAIGRKVAQNDRWLLAAALASDRVLITQDRRLAVEAEAMAAARVEFVERAS